MYPMFVENFVSDRTVVSTVPTKKKIKIERSKRLYPIDRIYRRFHLNNTIFYNNDERYDEGDTWINDILINNILIRNRIGFPSISTAVFPDRADPLMIKKYVSEIPEIYIQTLSSAILACIISSIRTGTIS